MGGLTGGLQGHRGSNKLEIPHEMSTANQSASGSNLDESQYTYYSESVNQSMMDADLGGANLAAAQEEDVSQIKADIERVEQEEEKEVPTEPDRICDRSTIERKSAAQVE